MSLDLDVVRSEADSATTEELERIYEKLSALRAHVHVLLLRQRVEDRLLSPADAAQFLGLKDKNGNPSARWVYRHVEELGGKHVSAHTIKIPLSGLRRFMERR